MSSLRDSLIGLYFDSEFLDDYLEHEGRDHNSASGKYTSRPIPGSGAYMYGTGDRILQHDFSLRARVKKWKNENQGGKEKELAAAMGYYETDKNGNIVKDENGDPVGSINKLRAAISIERNTTYTADRERAFELLNTIKPGTDRLYNQSEVAEIIFGSKSKESRLRNMLKNEAANDNAAQTKQVADKLKELVGDGNFVDVGAGTEFSLDCSQNRLNVALEMLKKEGYDVQTFRLRQIGKIDGTSTTFSVLCPPGSEPGDAFAHRFELKPTYEMEPGETKLSLLGIEDPVRVDLSRVKVLFGDDGGKEKDGMIEIRAVRDENGNLVAASPDLDMGNARYAQVRIAVDASSEGLGDRYIKGMAVYNTDLPKGVDILVNSNKNNLNEALKKMKTVKCEDGTETIDLNNPFGASVFQSHYDNGKLSALNIVGDPTGSDVHKEGAWDEWSRNLSPQFLGKQSETLITNQLDLKVKEMRAEYEQILQLNNPTVKKQMLLDFADSCDGASCDLKAAPLPDQAVKVLLAARTLKDNECYCPSLPNGTTVACVRFPHTGPFEIPIVKVNNNNEECKKFLEDSRGPARDCVVLNKNNANKLSGADNDGDTTVVIPMTKKVSDGQGGYVWDKTVNIKGIGNGAIELPGMKDFDVDQWKKADSQGEKLPGVKYLNEAQKQIQMGIVSNLMTDMTQKGCEDPEKLERCVKMTMITIDAVKHNLDWAEAEKYYRIKDLKEDYQKNENGKHGASTLLSRSNAKVDVAERKVWNPVPFDPNNPKDLDENGKPKRGGINVNTGEKVYAETNRTQVVREKVKVPSSDGYWTDKDGNKHRSKWAKDENGNFIYEKDENGQIKYQNTEKSQGRTQKAKRMSLVDNAEELYSDPKNPSRKEVIYANYANTMKAMANTARKEYLATPNLKWSREAEKKYANEVASLNKKLLDAKKNAPRERMAQLMATQIYNEMYANNPGMDKEEKSRKRSQALYGARQRTNAHKKRVKFTPEEWEAINAGAIAESKLKDLLKNADKESYTQLATPKQSRIAPATAKYIDALLKSGMSKTQIMESQGYSMDTINKVEAGGVSF